MNEVIAEKNGLQATLHFDPCGGDCNPRTESEHYTRICFAGTRNLRTFGDDWIGTHEDQTAISEDPTLWNLFCSEIVGQRPGTAVLYISKEDFSAFYGNEAEPLKVLESIAKEYRLWAEGEVYGYKIEDSRGEEQESCWGFIGEDFCKEAAIESLNWWAAHTPSETGIPGKVFINS